jgi:tetratricopeptide (TPR) repeat protein
MSVALNSLGDLSRLEGDYERAGLLYTEVARNAREHGAVFTRPGLLHNLAYVAHHVGEDERARSQFEEALSLYRDMGDRRGVAECVAGIATLETESNPRNATHLLSAALAAAEAMGSRLSSSNRGEYDRALAALHAALDETDFLTAWEKGRSMSLDEAMRCALGGACGDTEPVDR